MVLPGLNFLHREINKLVEKSVSFLSIRLYHNKAFIFFDW